MKIVLHFTYYKNNNGSMQYICEDTIIYKVTVISVLGLKKTVLKFVKRQLSAQILYML